MIWLAFRRIDTTSNEGRTATGCAPSETEPIAIRVAEKQALCVLQQMLISIVNLIQTGTTVKSSTASQPAKRWAEPMPGMTFKGPAYQQHLAQGRYAAYLCAPYADG
jgi:hypothetical protein